MCFYVCWNVVSPPRHRALTYSTYLRIERQRGAGGGSRRGKRTPSTSLSSRRVCLLRCCDWRDEDEDEDQVTDPKGISHNFGIIHHRLAP
jgi:hypothetical protein